MAHTLPPLFKEQTFLSPDVCLKDITFETTSAANTWLNEDSARGNAYMISSAMGMDFVIMAPVFLWCKYNGGTIRVLASLGLFYLIRAQLMKYFFLMRYHGYLFRFPGIGSVVIAYHDTNDFYYSGHIGSSTCFTLEAYALGHEKMALIAVFIIIYEWTFMCLTREHYIIDLLSGFVIAMTCHRVCEVLVYLVDVLILGLKKKDRDTLWYKACGRCGWLCCDA